MNRRDFIRNASSLLLIPAYVKAESLMKVAPTNIYLPDGSVYLGGAVNVRWFGARPEQQDNAKYIQDALNFAHKYCPEDGITINEKYCVASTIIGYTE